VHLALRDTTKCYGRLMVSHEMTPGTNVRNPDGSLTIATEHEIILIKDGVQSSRPNLKSFEVILDEAALEPKAARAIREGDAEARKALYADVDTEIVENYIARNRKSDEDAKLVRDMLAVFKDVTGGKTFVSAGRKDAEAFVQFQLTMGGKGGVGVSPGTVKRQVALLRAAINVERHKTDEPRVGRNIFDGMEIRDEEAEGREAYSEVDMATVRARLHQFAPDERLLWVWHASTGIRPSEIHGITHDDVEEAIDPNDVDLATGKPRCHRTRYIGIDKGKNQYSRRALPIPQAVLDLKDEDGAPLLPETITGPLFGRSVERLCDAINSKLQKWGINTAENGKVFYCCRHRVPRRLMDQGINDEQLSRAIMGHSRRIEPHHTYGLRRGYGHRYSMWRLKLDLDKIGI
jgi:hypothetical protein